MMINQDCKKKRGYKKPELRIVELVSENVLGACDQGPTSPQQPGCLVTPGQCGGTDGLS